MRIPRPRRLTLPFKRKWGAPPQATKLLRTSMVAGIVFMILLGVVFLPRMFVDQTPVAIIELRFDANVTRIDVTAVTAFLDLPKFRANYSENGTVIATLRAGLDNGNSVLRFSDRNANGLLDPGDYFDISCNRAAAYRFEILQVDVDRRVGFLSWTGCTTT